MTCFDITDAVCSPVSSNIQESAPSMSIRKRARPPGMSTFMRSMWPSGVDTSTINV